MPSLSYRTRVDLGVAAVTTAIGAFFTYQVSLIEAFAVDAIGPQVFPYFLSIAMIVLGLFVGVSALVFNQPEVSAEGGEHTAAEDAEEKFGFRDSDLGRVAAVIASGFLYIFLFDALGYLLSTALSLAVILLVFGNRSVGLIVMLSILGAIGYDYLFMNLMGLYDPPGTYFDLNTLLAD